MTDHPFEAWLQAFLDARLETPGLELESWDFPLVGIGDDAKHAPRRRVTDLLVWTPIAWSPAAARMASGSNDGTVRLWDGATGAILGVMKGHRDFIKSLAWSPSGHRLASGGGDGTVRLWDGATGESAGVLEGHTDWIQSLSWNPSGTLLASGALDGTVRLWDGTTGVSVGVLEGESKVIRLGWNPSGTLLAAADDDDTIRLWNGLMGASVRVLEGHSWDVNALAWNPSGTLLASGSRDTTVRLWDGATGASVGVLEGHTGWVNTLAWNPSGTLLASGSSDNTIRLWGGVTGAGVGVLEGHTDSVWTLAWNPSGTLLASGSGDKTVRLWDGATGASMGVLEGHTGDVNALAWNPSGTRLVSASGDGTVRLWDSDLDEARARWHFEHQVRLVRPVVVELLEGHLDLPREELVALVLADPRIDEDHQGAARTLVHRVDLTPDALDGLAWSLVDPDREEPGTDTAYGLRLTKRALELQGDAADAPVLKTHAWALFANGLHDEALAASRRALELASKASKPEYQSSLTRLEAAIAAAREGADSDETPDPAPAKDD